MKIDKLWQQVTAAPDDEELRRVLGDALLDAGDPRGELIQLQSMPLVEQTPAIVERCNDLIDAHWNDWLGVLTTVLVREGTYFRHGFLDEITVHGTANVRDHRELFTVRAVRPAQGVQSHYAQFVAELPREPIMLELDGRRLDAFARLRPTWSARGLCIHFTDDVLTAVPPVFPAVEQLELSPARTSHWDARRAVELIPQLAATFTHLTSVVLDCRVPYRWYPDGDAAAGEALLAEAGRSPLVTLRR